MSKFQKEYFNQIIKLIKNIQKNQKNKISQAAKLIKKNSRKRWVVISIWDRALSHAHY